ncbi:pyridoxamine 5'-phosphate oxidase family protein [Actinomadura bangladeshensis]|uniref:Pyridoxamine 5'-phosphate oxidase family protein n=1 Tax=Actinomadura bangladeshensis TaxID=453573 RepID=A0A6L9QXT4_9ACTN|nr:pyridoxamine 5'-phosphate oxidase family protein [Actinomadura bangladeshensis]NEA30046.1 pyridoxamine 5'-phosphate oxidase family protein [Actinomadura bangladeshensis]
MRSTGEALEVLGREECLALLRSAPVGRVVYTDQALPAIQPVTFVLDGDEAVVIRTAPGSKFDAALRGAIVAFEVDAFDPAARTGWSVTAVGQARAVTDPAEAARVARLPLRPWAPGPRDHFIRVPLWRVTGRRIPAAGERLVLTDADRCGQGHSGDHHSA